MEDIKNYSYTIIDYYPKVRKRSWIYKFTKRFFDILFSFLFIILLSWLYLIIAIILLITAKGRVIYIDKRVGKNNKIINVYKFTTMVKHANKKVKELVSEEQYEEWVVERKIDSDSRVTGFGKFLRATSLDELPQLFNILAGTMSFIGPRPITELEFLNFSEEQRALLLSVRPGLSGNWQVFSRNDTSFSSGKRQRIELEYFERCSLWYDTYLFFKTFGAVFSQRGAK